MEVELEELEKDREDILKSITERFEEQIESDNEGKQLLKEVEEALEELEKEEGEEAKKDRKKLQEIKKK